jgi:hypothetical protein
LVADRSGPDAEACPVAPRGAGRAFGRRAAASAADEAEGEARCGVEIITSQIPVDKWHELIGDPTYADAILDRIVHNGHQINLIGHSLRRSRATRASKD